jgi:hypothetical protein
VADAWVRTHTPFTLPNAALPVKREFGVVALSGQLVDMPAPAV